MKNTMTTNGEQGKSVKTNIAEVHASRVSCFPLDDIEFFEWTCTNKHGHLLYCPDISQSPILQRAIEKAIKKVRIMTHKAHCLPLNQKALNKVVISLLDLLLHTRRAMCWCHSIFTVLLFLYWRRTCHHCDMPPYCKESHFVKYSRSNSSGCATHSKQDQSIVFNGHH